MQNVLKSDFYYESLTREQAVQKLKPMKCGSYLLRRSSDVGALCTISAKLDYLRIVNLRIYFTADSKMCFIGGPEYKRYYFPTTHLLLMYLENDGLEVIMDSSNSALTITERIQLRYPVKPFDQVQWSQPETYSSVTRKTFLRQKPMMHHQGIPPLSTNLTQDHLMPKPGAHYGGYVDHIDHDNIIPDLNKKTNPLDVQFSPINQPASKPADYPNPGCCPIPSFSKPKSNKVGIGSFHN